MLTVMTKIPLTSCYTFDCVDGRLVGSSGSSWDPANADYDPGPPPPPKIKKGDNKEANAAATEQSETAEPSSSTAATAAVRPLDRTTHRPPSTGGPPSTSTLRHFLPQVTEIQTTPSTAKRDAQANTKPPRRRGRPKRGTGPPAEKSNTGAAADLA
jgi:hypothetical protein